MRLKERIVRRIFRKPSDRTPEYWEKAAITNPYSAICDGWSEEKFNAERESIIFYGTVELTKHMIVLDLACGIGRVAKFIAPIVKKYVGVDFSRNMIKKAIERYQGYQNVEFHVNDGRTLKEFDDNIFDLAFCELGFQHMEKDVTRSYVSEVYRVLKRNGAFLAQIPRFDYYHDVYAFTKEETDTLFARFSHIEYFKILPAYFLVKTTK